MIFSIFKELCNHHHNGIRRFFFFLVIAFTSLKSLSKQTFWKYNLRASENLCSSRVIPEQVKLRGELKQMFLEVAGSETFVYCPSR